MAFEASKDRAEVRITGSETDDHTVPVNVLVRVLQGLQQTALILAASREQKPIMGRFRPTEQMRQECELRCGPLTPGSVGVEVAFQERQANLFSAVEDREATHLMGQVFSFLTAAATSDTASLERIIPDSKFRARALRATLGYLPAPGQRWEVELSNGVPGKVRLTQRTRATVEGWFREGGSEATALIGQLVRIDFAKNKVVIRYPPTNRDISCDYEVDTEDSLIQCRRDWVQVHGEFAIDREGHPSSAIAVSRIEPLDFSPLTVETFDTGHQTLRVDPPLELLPYLDQESKQLLEVEDSELDIFAYASTREELEKELISQLSLLWSEYGMEAPDRLVPSAQILRENLLRRIKVSQHAP